MKGCPKCSAVAVQFGKPHCPSLTCTWFTCTCKAVYDREGDRGFRSVGKESWHSSQAA